MKRVLWAALAVFLGLGFSAQSAFAGGYYEGSTLYVARANTPVFDCARSACETNIRLRRGSYIYAECWDGGEGMCRIKTKFFTNMYLPRYALDAAYGDGGHSGGYKDCYYKESYSYSGASREGCYDRARYPRRYRSYRDDCYGKSYGYRSGCSYRDRPRRHAYKAYSYTKEYSYKKGNGYFADDEQDGYDQED
jgi:hypothetical protein